LKEYQVTGVNVPLRLDHNLKKSMLFMHAQTSFARNRQIKEKTDQF